MSAQTGLIEEKAINDMVDGYQAHKMHELVGRIDEIVSCAPSWRQAAQTLADALASKGVGRVQSFLLSHTTFLRRFYRRIKGER